jgi:serine O-acetyltransferase
MSTVEPSLTALIAEDWRTHSRSFTSPGLHALVVHRISVALSGRPGALPRLVARAAHVVNVLVVRNVYGMEVSATTTIGRRVRIGHHMGVLLGAGAVIGDDCLIRQHVTLGQAGGARGEASVEREPRIGSRVIIGAGASVLGPVTVGDGARIGAHALVLKDVPAGATAMSTPARVLLTPPSAGRDGSDPSAAPSRP